MRENAFIDRVAVAKAVVVSLLCGAVIGAVVGSVGFALLLIGVLTDDVAENSTIFHGFLFCLGMFPDLLGGYLAAAFARRNEIAHGAVTGVVLLIISGLFYLFPDEDPFTIGDAVGLLLVVPLAVSGSVIFHRTY